MRDYYMYHNEPFTVLSMFGTSTKYLVYEDLNKVPGVNGWLIQGTLFLFRTKLTKTVESGV